MFLIADPKFICALLGHMGATALNLCPFCKISNIPLKLAEHWEYNITYPDQMMEEYNIAARTARSSDLTRTRLSELSMSVCDSPLFDIPVGNICPPLLHIVLGLGIDLYKLLEEKCREIDRASSGLSVDINKAKEDLMKELDKAAKLEDGIDYMHDELR